MSSTLGEAASNGHDQSATGGLSDPDEVLAEHLPSAALFVLAGTVGGSDLAPSLALGAPALIVYPVAAWLWLRARRQPAVGRAWVLAVLGFVLIVGSSVAPVTVFGTLIVDERRESQPGGRGYRG
ncbi:hypothetical protein [Micromonospora sp. NPDC023888]|uniref:hypothetical protein n=1 Tax=Micromonospora sp. NPDC023888 TaxID=3155607 RepID=UPI0033E7D015